MFVNPWLYYLVCHTKYLVFLPLQMGVGKEVSSNVCIVGYAATRLYWHLFLLEKLFFGGRNVVWFHPLEKVLKSTLGKLRCVKPFLKPCTLSEVLFIPERFAEYFTEFYCSHFTHISPSG